MTRAAIYLRAIPQGASLSVQVRELRAAAEGHGWVIAHELEEGPRVLGPVRDQRPILAALLKEAAAGHIDVLAVHSLTALVRSKPDLERTLDRLEAAGCRLYVHAGRLDTGASGGIEAVRAALASEIRSARAAAANVGHTSAKARGRPIGAPRVSAEKEAVVRDLRRQGVGILRTARLAGVGVGTVQRIDREDAAKPCP